MKKEEKTKKLKESILSDCERLGCKSWAGALGLVFLAVVDIVGYMHDYIGDDKSIGEMVHTFRTALKGYDIDEKGVMDREGLKELQDELSLRRMCLRDAIINSLGELSDDVSYELSRMRDVIDGIV